MGWTSLELCAGAGGQALGLEQAGFEHRALVELDPWACETLRTNRPLWDVREQDLRETSGVEFVGVDLVAGGVPCPPFSVAGRQLGPADDRDLLPALLRIVGEVEPKAVLVENVPGLLTKRFRTYRLHVARQLDQLGYRVFWTKLNASDFSVPQLRPRSILVALRAPYFEYFTWPVGEKAATTVGDALHPLMAEAGWVGADRWASDANTVAPTLVGGSKKHGGPDLGPTRAKQAWLSLGVDGRGIADAPPAPGFEGTPRLTVEMCARLQGFPTEWRFVGGKTAAYRQVGNAFPPPVARAVARAIGGALDRKYQNDNSWPMQAALPGA